MTAKPKDRKTKERGREWETGGNLRYLRENKTLINNPVNNFAITLN
jgi:hypothetical protein